MYRLKQVKILWLITLQPVKTRPFIGGRLLGLGAAAGGISRVAKFASTRPASTSGFFLFTSPQVGHAAFGSASVAVRSIYPKIKQFTVYFNKKSEKISFMMVLKSR